MPPKARDFSCCCIAIASTTPAEVVWIGWERKRGKLMDLNKLLRNEYDSFPVKIGDLSVLQSTRFVVTMDADTELPRGSAHRMVGTLAHSLNQGIIDPRKNIVVAGYGILQPRVGVSVQSAARSRLASIFSGETGFDIYTEPSPMFTRISTAKVALLAKASTRWKPSTACLIAASRAMPF